MSTVVQGILLAVIGVLLFGLIIFIHEFGHFFTAKLSHVCVNEFSIGMGPKLFSFTRGETQYSLRLLPIGGYCAMEGEDEKSDDPRAFGNRPVWQRMIVVAAGGIMNILLAVLLMMVICGQEDRYATMRIAGFAENSAFEAAGVEVGDVITSIDGYTVRTGQDLSFALSMAALDSTDSTAALDLTVKRGEETVTFNDMTINTTSADGKQYRAVLDFYVLGEERTPWTLIKNAFADMYSTVRMIFNSLIGIVTGRFGFSGLAGPVGTAQAVTQAASAGLKQSFGAAVNNIVYIMLVISVNLGIVNLLPLPALDGGRLVFLIIEAIFRRPAALHCLSAWCSPSRSRTSCASQQADKGKDDTMKRISKQVMAGNVKIGGGAPVTVQSMLNVPSTDIEGSVRQAVALEKAGCQILRAAIPDMDAVRLIPAIKEKISIPLVADIHFDYKLALEAAAAGVDKIRINPGNIGGDDRVKAVATVCREKKIPIRIGVNSGSVEKSILAKYGAPTAEALCESALYHASLLEKFDFTDIVISLKSSSVDTNIKAYEMIAERCDYPLHLGVTETGTLRMGIVKSAIGIGSLLQRGIGDTLRVSLTADPAEEIRTGRDILSALGLRGGVKLVSCPTCGRTRIDLIGLANKVEKALEYVDKDITVAVMGCVVNGPGEAREADLGVTGGKGEGLIFKKGQIIRKVPEAELLDALMEEIDKL